MEELNCTFCTEFSNNDTSEFRSYITKEELDSRIVLSSTNFIALAGLGAMRDGYLLMLPKAHILSFAYLEPSLAFEAQNFKEKAIQAVKHFSSDLIIFEHGDVEKENTNTGGCIDHAHFHFYPSHVNLLQILMDQFEHRRIYHITDLFTFKQQRQPYLYYEKNETSYAFLVNENLPSQYMRRILMTAEGKPDEWDWSVFVGKTNVINTVKKLNGHVG